MRYGRPFGEAFNLFISLSVSFLVPFSLRTFFRSEHPCCREFRCEITQQMLHTLKNATQNRSEEIHQFRWWRTGQWMRRLWPTRMEWRTRNKGLSPKLSLGTHFEMFERNVLCGYLLFEPSRGLEITAALILVGRITHFRLCKCHCAPWYCSLFGHAFYSHTPSPLTVRSTSQRGKPPPRR